MISLNGNMFLMLIPNCPEGLIGIIVGKIQEKTKNTIVFTITANGNLKGSVRCNDYMNVKLFLDKHKELFLKYGTKCSRMLWVLRFNEGF